MKKIVQLLKKLISLSDTDDMKNLKPSIMMATSAINHMNNFTLTKDLISETNKFIDNPTAQNKKDIEELIEKIESKILS